MASSKSLLLLLFIKGGDGDEGDTKGEKTKEDEEEREGEEEEREGDEEREECSL